MIRKELISDLTLEAGGALKGAHVVFHTSQESWDGRRPVIWICHALTANSDPEDWWPEMVGPGKAVDTEKNFVVCVNMLGSPYGSEGPARENPETGRPWLLDFPKVTVRDMVAASICVRKALGINSVDLLVGSSIGGFQAIEWAVTEPGVFKRCAFIATAPRVSPYLSATVEAQRMALEADPTFREARDLSGGAAGLKCARAQALISYRCFEGYALTQAEEDPDTLFAGRAASYERYWRRPAAAASSPTSTARRRVPASSPAVTPSPAPPPSSWPWERAARRPPPSTNTFPRNSGITRT